MDTPQKTQITASCSKFEDSPVFNYINSLSPIQPVKSIHSTQTFQSLSFSSLPSIFTSPHVSYQKESRFLRRHSNSDPSKPEFSSENGSKITSHEGAELDIAQLYDHSSELQENFDQEASVGQSDCVLEVSQMCLPEGEENILGIYQTEQGKEAAESDWENLITDSSDLLIFNSPIDTEAFKGLMERSMDCNEVPEMPVDHMGSSRNPIVEVENEMVVSGLHRGMRRRCLDFDTRVSSSSSASREQLNEKVASKVKQVIPGGDFSRPVLPGIGLHLNALAITSKDNKNVEIEVLSSPVASFQSPTTGQELNESLTLATEQEMDSIENAVDLVEDVSQTSTCLITEEFSNNCPKKKRRKLEVEIEGCKRCNCKKSKCLKLYCECFAAGVYCIEPCSCQECFNTPNHEDTVLATRKQIESRNPLAFAPKVIRGSESVAEIGDDSNKTPASARHKRGCNCKKSNCLKKYCECYQGGVGCSINCRCEGCKNIFGRKDGSVPPEAEEETVGEETNGAEKASQKLEIPDIEEQNQSSLPITPLSLSRPLLRLPFSSKGKPPRYGSSSRTNTNQKYGKPNILRHEQNFDRQQQIVPDDDIPAILQDNYSSPVTGTRTSPNGKRVSPPHGIIRSGRKLILQSIPSFPCLNPHN